MFGSCHADITSANTISEIIKNKKKDTEFFEKLKKENIKLASSLRVFQAFAAYGRYDLLREYVDPSLRKNLLIRDCELVEEERKDGIYYDYDNSILTNNYARFSVKNITIDVVGIQSIMKYNEYWVYSNEDDKWFVVSSSFFTDGDGSYIRMINEKITRLNNPTSGADTVTPGTAPKN
jgi:hypothetical protein